VPQYQNSAFRIMHFFKVSRAIQFMLQASTADAAQTQPYKELDFTDAQKAYGSSKTSELVRAWLVSAFKSIMLKLPPTKSPHNNPELKGAANQRCSVSVLQA